MQKMQKLFLFVLFILSSAYALAGPGGVTYLYSGTAFDQTNGDYAGIGAIINGQITFSEALPPRSNIVGIDDLTITSYEFSDGVQTLTHLNSKFLFFHVYTDSNGVPNRWVMRLARTPVTTANGGQVAGIQLFFLTANSDETGTTDGVCFSNGGPGGECDVFQPVRRLT